MEKQMNRLFMLILATIFLCGCGPKMPDTIPVSGKVTCGGKEWPNPGMLYFAPKENSKGLLRRPATAKFAVDGTFEVTSFKPGDGLVQGTYIVTIECWKKTPSMQKPTGISAVPMKYQNQSTSDFIIDVDMTKPSIEINFDLLKGAPPKK